MAGTPARIPGYLSASDLQTSSATKTSERIKDDHKKKKAKFKADKKKNRAKKNKPGAGPKPAHASSLRDLKGVLAKDAYYAQNGHDHLEADAGRHTIFKDFDMAFAKHSGLPKKILEEYRFPRPKAPENFNPNAKDVAQPRKKAGKKYPYHWEAHHILPGSSFYYRG